MAGRKAGFLTQPLAGAVLWCIMAIRVSSQSKMAWMNHTHTHTANCTQIEPMGFSSTIWTTRRKPLSVLRIKVSVWSQWKYYMKKNNVQDVCLQNCIESLFHKEIKPFCSLSEYDSLSGFFWSPGRQRTAQSRSEKGGWFPPRRCDCINLWLLTPLPGRSNWGQ